MELFDFQVMSDQISNLRGVQKFGRSTKVDNGDKTDVWDGAQATQDQKIYIAPTQARAHTIVSTHIGDTNTDGAGAKQVEVSGLVDWQTAEVSEITLMDGTTPVALDNDYVFINRAEVVKKGGMSSNIGVITIVAAVEGTISAQINAGIGQTGMAIMAIARGETAYIPRPYANFNKATGAAAACDLSLLVNSEPDVQELTFVTKHTWGLMTVGTSAFLIPYGLPKKFVGPAIIKIQAIGDADNLDVSAGFDALVEATP